MYEYEITNRIPILMAISTCPRCDRMKKFLKSSGVNNVVVVDVDLLDKEQKRAHLKFLQPMNPGLSFPSLIVGDLVVIGEDYAGIREVLGL